MSPFRAIGQLFLGDGVAKVVNFVVFIYLARVLGVAPYGTLEFALAIAAYLQFGSDAGLELWAMRAVSQGRPPAEIIGSVVAVRVVLAVVGGLAVLGVIGVFPDYPGLVWLVGGLALRVVIQACDLRWVFMAQQRMKVVAGGLIIGHVLFAILVIATVHRPDQVVWVPLAQAGGYLGMVIYFGLQVRPLRPALRVRWQTIRAAAGPSLTMGVSRALALLSYNFDTLAIGFLASVQAVGLYAAAYRPLAALLAVSSTYFLGLFPALAKAHVRSHGEFQRLLERSIHLTALVGLPVAVAGWMLAEDGLRFLFGESYVAGAPAMQWLAISVALVVLRGSYRQALCATGYQRSDLLWAAVATAVNVGLNLWWIPRLGIVGAAQATVVSETIWVVAVAIASRRRLGVLSYRWLPGIIIATLGLTGALVVPLPGSWGVRLTVGLLVYGSLLLAVKDDWARRWLGVLIRS